ncbi:MAG: hypothetical protein KY475_03090 [Planctomycetes bacterium]|nr:hypothetical protein [Planctomycetota bacterium]
MPTTSRAARDAKSRRPRSAGRRSASYRRDSGEAWRDVLGDGPWDPWRTHLAERTAPRPLAELTHSDESPLLWAVPEGCSEVTRRVLNSAADIHHADGHALVEFAGWMEQDVASSGGGDDRAADFGLTRLAWAHALGRLATVMNAAAWRGAMRRLLAAVEESAAIPLDYDPLGRLLLGGELPWTLAWQFPELEECRRLSDPAAAALSEGLIELLDGEGVLHARHWHRLRPLLALWTRCGLMAGEARRDCFTRDARQQYQWLVQHSALLSRPDGGQLLSPGDEGRWSEPLFETALRLADDKAAERLARVVLPLAGKQKSARTRGKAPPAAIDSEWARVGLLRPAATADSPRLIATYADRRLRAELTNRDEVVFSGAWDPHIEVDRRQPAAEGDWEEVCWQSDADVDYLELQLNLAGGWRVQRHMLLARKDGFLFVADAVLGKTPASISYRCTTPLMKGVAFLEDAETRDGMLEGKRKLAVAMPLALPEWRSDRRIGSLTSSAAGLELTMSGEGTALFAPLFFDLTKRRFKKDRTWRRLTVAETLQICRPDAAVGYRVQAGKEQWMFYRSLAPAANRTLLGQNFSSEFVAARFNPNGYAEELISIISEE